MNVLFTVYMISLTELHAEQEPLPPQIPAPITEGKHFGVLTFGIQILICQHWVCLWMR